MHVKKYHLVEVSISAHFEKKKKNILEHGNNKNGKLEIAAP